jgi:hypothetical protein
MAIPYSSALAGSVLMLYYVVKNWWTEAGLTPTHKANESEEQGKQGLDSGSAASSETGV